MIQIHRATAAMFSALLLCGGHAHAATAWDEAASGDLSSSGLAPTPLSFASGANTVSGTIGSSDSDYFSFEVPAGMALSAVIMNPGTSVSGGASFFAIQAGPQVTYPVGGAGALLAYNHYDPSLTGTNILVGYLLPPSSPGLLAGTYSIWLNETGGDVPYSFDFVLTTAVPEPAASALLAAGLLIIGLQRRSARRAAKQPYSA